MEQFVNYAIITLAAPCSSLDATITVSNPTALPTSGTYRLVVDNEIMMATARTGAVVSVARGQEGTAVAGHGMGTLVQPALTSAALRQLLVDARFHDVNASNYWAIDPIGGNNANTGIDDAHPLKDLSELIARFGTTVPIFNSDVTVHLLNSQPDTSDRVFLTPYMVEGGKFYLQGTWVQVATGTFASVTPGSKSAADGRWRADLGTAAAGKLANRGLYLVNTTRGNSVAAVRHVLSGTLVVLTHPMDSAATVSPTLPSPTPALHTDWVAGDTWVLYQLPTVYIAQFQGQTIASDSTGDFVFCFANHIYVPDPAISGEVGNTNIILGKGVAFVESWVDCCVIYPLLDTFGEAQAINCVFAGGGAYERAAIIGGALGQSDAVTATLLYTSPVDGETILEGTAIVSGQSTLGQICCDNATIIAFDQTVMAGYGGYGDVGLYGTYTLGVGGSTAVAGLAGIGSVAYGGTAANAFRGVPTITLDLQSVAIAEDLTLSPTARYANRALTPTLLDTAIGSGGFGGIAKGYFGSFIAKIS